MPNPYLLLSIGLAIPNAYMTQENDGWCGQVWPSPSPETVPAELRNVCKHYTASNVTVTNVSDYPAYPEYDLSDDYFESYDYETDDERAFYKELENAEWG